MDGTSISNPNLIEDDDPFNILAYFSSLQNQDQNFQFTNDNFTHELQLQETLLSSIPPPSSSSPPSSSMILCEICMDTKPDSEMFRNTNICAHLYCLDCIRGHVAAKIKENITKVKCPHPQCVGLIGPEACRWIVPKEVIERWEDSLCESSILASEKVTYCPFKDCSAMLVDDGGETVTSSVCPNCNRLFCASCKVGWHAGLNCSEFRSRENGGTDREDQMLMDLANKKRWKRCPSCKFFVEKKSGCMHIACSGPIIASLEIHGLTIGIRALVLGDLDRKLKHFLLYSSSPESDLHSPNWTLVSRFGTLNSRFGSHQFPNRNTYTPDSDLFASSDLEI
ncbi:hypothetical protein OSB04_028536 [Centaurea solstitialis]|uniref:RBR-type E3 ubiquitin transferase n=1 Tax=Centaurea solstitialis TaxID=347529 RepID=A0AA38W7T9_9ASTR|nr:hypothetical protein OSB04_028536 [Centaurea solstitialis]